MTVEISSELIGAIEDINVHEIVLSPNNPRNQVDNFQELIESINNIGPLQPIVVRTVDNHLSNCRSTKVFWMS